MKKMPIFSKVRKEKLAYTLLVKNEIDIILDNIYYHLSQGVDKVLVTDNGSTDGTLELLQELEKKGIIDLSQEEYYNQDKIVNAMGLKAREKYGATILIHSDADEFWHSSVNNLKKSFLALKHSNLSINRYDVLPIPEDRAKVFPNQRMWILKKHIVSENSVKDCEKVGLFLFKTPPKVMFSVSDNFKEVGFGNHYLSSGEGGYPTEEIEIYHFPFKSTARFLEKVIQGGEAFQRIKTERQIGWHWKRWYKQYKQNKMTEEIERLTPDMSKVKGIEYEDFDYNETILQSILSNHKLVKGYKRYKVLQESLEKGE